MGDSSEGRAPRSFFTRTSLSSKPTPNLALLAQVSATRAVIAGIDDAIAKSSSRRQPRDSAIEASGLRLPVPISLDSDSDRGNHTSFARARTLDITQRVARAATDDISIPSRHVYGGNPVIFFWTRANLSSQRILGCPRAITKSRTPRSIWK